MRRKTRVHKVVVRLVFDKPLLRRHAVYEAQQNIHGDFYTVTLPYSNSAPEMFKVKGIKSYVE